MSDQLECTRLARSKPSWPILRLKHIAQLTGGGTPAKENAAFWTDGDVPWVSPKDMKRRVITETEDYITRAAVDGSATSYVEAGSPLVVVRSGILRHTLPVAIAGCRLTLNQDMKAFRLSERLNKQFFAYWIEGQSSDLLLEWRQFGATVESIDTFRMMNGRLAVPDLDTQKAIVAFLDSETARLDLLIGRKERFLALLAEKQQSLIASATEHDGPLTKLGHHVSLLPGYAFASANFSTDKDDVRLLRGVNVAPGRIRWDDTAYWPKGMLSDVERFSLAAGDIVLGMDRPWISAGIRVAEVTQDDLPCLLLQRVCRIKPLASLDKGYMKLLLASRRLLAHFEPIMTGVSVPHISGDQIAAFRFPFIEVSKQRMAATVCEHSLARIKVLEDRIVTSIDRLRERRLALITAAVTGQIDVSAQANNVTTVKADRHRFRVIVGTEIIDRHQGVKRFGRVKLQKLLFLAETHVGIPELGGVYLREAAGPLDRELLAEAERGMMLEGFFQPNTQEDDLTTGVSYKPLANVGRHRHELTSLLGARGTELTRIINLLKQFETKAVEAITTIYAAWNDALLDGAKSDDAAIIKSVLKDWHPEKAKKFKEADLCHWLDWMRRNGLVPIGRGPKTTTGRFFP